LPAVRLTLRLAAGLLLLPIAACARQAATPSPAPLTPAAAATPASGTDAATASPDGRWMASVACCNVGSVIDVGGQRAASLHMFISAHLVGWTVDSRFAVFGGRHPAKYITFTYVFDVDAWDWILVTPGCTLHGGDVVYSDPCGEYPVAIAPNASRFLMENGLLINLPSLEQVDLMPDLRGRSPLIHFPMAAWSPDGAYLAWVLLTYPRPGFAEFETALYLAHGDGSNVQRFPLSDQFPRSFAWSSDSRKVTVAVGPEGHREWTYFVVEAATGATTVTPAP
jgi:hypothetical protein